MEDMQSLQTLPLIIVAVYMVGMMLAGYIIGKKQIKDSKDYMVAGRRQGLFMVAFSLSANNVGGGSTTGLAAKAFGDWGMSACWYVIAAAIAMIPLAYFAPKIRKTMALTIPEVIGRRFGKAACNISAILNVLSLFCLTSSQIFASAVVINTLTGVPQNVALVLAGLVVVFYTTFGGMVADQFNDLVQFIVILAGLAIATPIVINCVGGWKAISEALPPAQLDFTKIGWVTIIGYIFNYFCTFLSGPEMVSRFETAKDEKTATNASLLSAVLMAAMSLFPTILGLAALAVKDAVPGMTAANSMMTVTSAYAPQFVVGLIAAAILCATMSSADSNLLCMSTMIMNDLYFGNGGNRNIPEKKIILMTRICNIVCCALAVCISLFGIDIVTMNTFAFGLRCAGPFAAYGLGMVVPKATKHSGILSIVTGTIGFFVWQFLSGGSFLFGILPVVFGCGIGALTFLVVNLIEWKMGVEPAPAAFIEGAEH